MTRGSFIFIDLGDDTFEVVLPDATRQALTSLAHQLDQVVVSDSPETRRLFPTAYPNDPERDAGYQILARDQLIDQRKEAIALLVSTANEKVLTADELSSWMAVVNDVRLVLGTTLDISEDGHDYDEDDPDADLFLLYDQLSALVHEMVLALSTSLPEVEDDDPVDL